MMFLNFIVLSTVLSIIRVHATTAWMDKSKSPTERAMLILAEMTLDEKIVMLHGTNIGNHYTGYVAGNDRLGIPALTLNDGPSGFRADWGTGASSTCWPSALTVAATFDVNILARWGKALGKEFHDKGANVLLGPGLNLARIPLNGRNFEYLSGGDPFLGYTLVKPLVENIQSNHVIANAKHWVHNNQETDRDTVSATVDERTRFELYYQPFLGAIEAGVHSFMCSYSKIDGVWSCENSLTLSDLKEKLHFDGWVMSDWGGCHSTSINEGLDQEMPGDIYFGSMLYDAVTNGTVSMDKIDDSVRRILVPMFDVGIFDYPNDNTVDTDVRSVEHTLLAREISAKSHVLLKNKDNVLPLKTNKPMKIAMIGQAAREPVIAGGGSGAVFPSYIVSPYEGMLNYLNIIDKEKAIPYSCNSTLHENVVYNQWGCEGIPATSVEDCCNSCGKYSNCHYFTYNSGSCMMYPTDGQKRPTTNGAISGECKKVAPPTKWNCNEDDVCIAVIDGKDADVAEKLAMEADVAIVVVSTFAKEGSDRESLTFDAFTEGTCELVAEGQDDLVTMVASTGVKTIVAITAPGAVLMPWKEDVHAILWGGLPGLEYGNALADILFNKVNPSGRLPQTMPNVENEVGFSKDEYPGIVRKETYNEGLLVDYRWYTAHNVKPAFAFGHGLSYTTFTYSNLLTDGNKISVTITNNGAYEGSDVPQLYLGFPSLTESPPMQLKGFVKTSILAPSEAETVSFELTDHLLSVWDVATSNYKVYDGSYKIYVGASSEDIRLTGTLTV